MITRRTNRTSLFVVLVTIIALWMTGCASSKRGKAAESSDSTANAPARLPVTSSTGIAPKVEHTPADESATSADILARKAQSYAENLAPLIAQRSTPDADARQPEIPSEPNTASGVATKETEVKWTAPQAAPTNEGETVIRDATSNGPALPPSASGATAPIQKQSKTAPVVAAADLSTLAANTPAKVPKRPTPPPMQALDADDAIKASANSGSAVPALPSDPASVDIDKALDAKLTQQAKDDPRDPAAQLDLQLMHFIRGDAAPDQSSLAKLPQEDRDTLSALIDGLSNYRSQLRVDNNMLLGKKVKPLLDMADRLRASSDLEISKISICREVLAFGQYEPIEGARLIALKDQSLKPIIYCEVSNFSSTPNDRSIWETKLKYSASLYTENGDGIEVWKGKPTEIVDLCRNRRKDFFIRDQVTLPPTVQLGGYLFKVTIVDEQANRVAEASTPIQVVAR